MKLVLREHMIYHTKQELQTEEHHISSTNSHLQNHFATSESMLEQEFYQSLIWTSKHYL